MSTPERRCRAGPLCSSRAVLNRYLGYWDGNPATLAPLAPADSAPRGTSPGLARAMTTEQWWDAVAIRVDSARADGMSFTMNFLTPDAGQRFVVEMTGAANGEKTTGGSAPCQIRQHTGN